MSIAKAVRIADKLAKLAKALGADQAVVMIGMPDGEHSAYSYRVHGACLPVRGLIETCRDDYLKQSHYTE